MALIEKAKGRREGQSPSGYTRLFGIDALGRLMSRIQGTVISSGTELEKLIWERVQQIDDLDKFIAETIHTIKDGIWVANKWQIKKSKTIQSRYEPDFLAIDLKSRFCYVIEVKDGDTFDTKKASGEHTTLHNFTNDVSEACPFSFRIYLCSFNATTIDEIYNGLKKKFAKTELMTGKALCTLLDIDYDEIVKVRTSDQQSNLEHFVKELLSIDTIRNMIVKFLKNFTP